LVPVAEQYQTFLPLPTHLICDGEQFNERPQPPVPTAEIILIYLAP
jgi:hypothetical protein